jgi:hypothetical protein
MPECRSIRIEHRFVRLYRAEDRLEGFRAYVNLWGFETPTGTSE